MGLTGKNEGIHRTHIGHNLEDIPTEFWDVEIEVDAYIDPRIYVVMAGEVTKYGSVNIANTDTCYIYIYICTV